MNDQERIRKLFEKYLRNSCTPEEAQELIRLMQSDEDKDYMTSVIDHHLQTTPNERNDEDAEKATKKVFDKLDLTNTSKVKRVTKTFFIAAAVIFMAALSYTLTLQIKTHEDIQVAVADDISPGSNKATLTMSDGTVIALDDATTGTILDYEGISIQRTKTGELLYHIDNHEMATPVLNTISTPAGGQHQIILPDGTRVWLNASSSLTFPLSFNGRIREVFLTGEGYFDVSPLERDEHQVPFIVETASQRIEVLGTQFNVNDYADQGSCNTTLLEGSVKIVTGNQSILLQPGEQARVNDQGIVVATVDTETVVDWKNGDFLFVDEDLTSIMHKISRWYDVEVVFEKNMARDGYSGMIARSKNLSEVLHILELSGELETHVENRTVYLSAKKHPY